jgi:hypothetical protein
MSEELGKIERPAVNDFKSGRKLYFVPLLMPSQEAPPEYSEICDRFWQQVESQITNLEVKLGQVRRIFHELIFKSGDEGTRLLKELNASSYRVVQRRIENGARLEALEDDAILTELMDWSRCLSLDLQNRAVVSKIYQFYEEANKKRNEFVSKILDETLKTDEVGILFLAENHRIQFPAGVSIIYVSPPALDEARRWMRDREAKLHETKPNGPGK